MRRRVRPCPRLGGPRRGFALLALVGLALPANVACGGDDTDGQAAARDAAYCATYGSFDARERLSLVDPDVGTTSATREPVLAEVTGTAPAAVEARRFLADSHHPKDAPEAIRPPVSLLHRVITDGDVARARSSEVADAVDEINRWLRANCGPVTSATR